MAGTDPLEDCIGFDWDEGNTIKNWELHGVSPEEAEDVFFHELFVVHSKKEKRHYALGKTGSGSRLFVSFIIRRKLIRVISVRDMNRNEAELYGLYEKEEGS